MSFEERNRVQQQLTDALRAEISDAFGLALRGPGTDVSGGDEAGIWKIDSDRGPLVVRIAPQWKTDAELRWVHELTTHVATSVPETVAPLLTRSGSTLIRHSGYPVSVFPFVDGAMVDELTTDIAFQAGGLLARVHAALATWTQPRPAPGEASPYVRQQVELPPDPELATWHAKLGGACQFVHGDYYDRNLLVRERQIVALIDWDEAKVDYVGQELAWAIWEFAQTQDGVIDDPLASALLDGYVTAGGRLPKTFHADAVNFIRWRLRWELELQLTAKAHGEPEDEEYFAFELAAYQSIRGAVLFPDTPSWERTSRGRAWLADVPRLLDTLRRDWDLEVDMGTQWHGAHSIVLPARRDGQDFVVKLNSDDDTDLEARALRAWDGNGAVRLIEERADVRALLLERLSPSTLNDLELYEAAEVAGTLLRRLAIPAPDGFPKLRDMATYIADSLPERNRRLCDPVPSAWVDKACVLAGDLSSTANLLVHSDLHYGNIHAGHREPWLAIDPRPVAGDPEVAVPELLWFRHDEIDGPTGLQRLIDILIRSGDLDLERANAWAITRCVDYWLWGLDHGLTEDPIRCRRILDVLT